MYTLIKVLKGVCMTTISKRSKMSYIILVVSILVLVLSIIAITYASYRKSVSIDNEISFDKISITADSKFGVNTNTAVYAGATITDGDIAFFKSSDSKAVYVRARLRFSLAESGTDEQMAVMQKYLDDLNNIDLPVVKTVQNGAVWRVESDGFYYLVSDTDRNLPKLLIDSQRYVFCGQVVIPTTFKQYTDDASLLLPIKMELAIEAVQAEGNSDKNFAQMKDVFNDTF